MRSIKYILLRKYEEDRNELNRNNAQNVIKNIFDISWGSIHLTSLTSKKWIRILGLQV